MTECGVTAEQIRRLEGVVEKDILDLQKKLEAAELKVKETNIALEQSNLKLKESKQEANELKRQIKPIETRLDKCQRAIKESEKLLKKAKSQVAEQKKKSKELQAIANQKSLANAGLKRQLENSIASAKKLDTALRKVAKIEDSAEDNSPWNDTEWAIYKTTDSRTFRVANLQNDFTFGMSFIDGKVQISDIKQPPRHVVEKVIEMASAPDGKN